MPWMLPFIFFFFNDTATTEIYTLSLHDALPISLAVPAQETDDHARARADADGEQPHPQGDPAAVDDTAQDVAADVVRPEQVALARRREPDLRLGRERIVGGQHVRKDRRQHEQDEDGSRGQPEGLA